MRKIMIVTPLVATAALVLLAAGPAFAADTPATFQITGDPVTISAPESSVNLGTITSTVGGATTGSDSLGAVTVTDARNDTINWTATVQSSPFTVVGTPTKTVAASEVTYTNGAAATTTGTVTVSPTNPVLTLADPQTVQVGSGVSGLNTASWSPSISVAIPDGALVGTYSGTVTHAVS
jgi:hypothetical protein